MAKMILRSLLFLGLLIFPFLLATTSRVFQSSCEPPLLNENDYLDDNRKTTTTKKDQSQNQQTTVPTTTTTTTALPRSATANGLSKSALQQWCPYAQCDVTRHICHPCTRRFLILLATGRSASTTLKNMLHSLPGVRISGENNNMLGNLMTAIDATRRYAAWKGAFNNPYSAWGHQPVPNASFACVTQQMVETINPPPPPLSTAPGADEHQDDDDHDTIIGFKTIRFANNLESVFVRGGGKKANTGNQQVTVQQAAEFLTESFPCAKFLINIRSNVTSQALSAKKTFGFNPPLDELENRNQQLLHLQRLLGPQRAHVLDSTEWTQNISLINHMVSSWLGFSKACHFVEPFQSHVAGGKRIVQRINPPGCVKLVAAAAAA